MTGLLGYTVPLIEAAFGDDVGIAGTRLLVPGTLPIRLSVVASNVRMHGLFDRLVAPGATVVDVGANIGYNAVYAATLVGPTGCVYAIEPAGDNVEVLRRNVARNGLPNVVVCQVAAGCRRERRDFFLRGDVSAVNSLYPESMYGPVSAVGRVSVEPLDDLVPDRADLVKIDVEGAELEVLAGMTRLLSDHRMTLIVEWHPRLQEAAGVDADALPRELLRHGFRLSAVSHTGECPLMADAIGALTRRLREKGRPVEIVATRARRDAPGARGAKS